jgi:AcrR family transcriptional regulator
MARRGDLNSRMRDMIAKGEKLAVIAAKLGVSRSTVYRHRARMRSPARSSSTVATVGVRLSEAEIAALDRLVAANGGWSRSRFLRNLVRHAAGFYAPNPEEDEFLAGAEKHLSRLGGNFNQIAFTLSAAEKRGELPAKVRAHVAELHKAADEVEEIRAVLAQMLHVSQVRASLLQAALKPGQGGEHDGA